MKSSLWRFQGALMPSSESISARLSGIFRPQFGCQKPKFKVLKNLWNNDVKSTPVPSLTDGKIAWGLFEIARVRSSSWWSSFSRQIDIRMRKRYPAPFMVPGPLYHRAPFSTLPYSIKQITLYLFYENISLNFEYGLELFTIIFSKIPLFSTSKRLLTCFRGSNF